MTTTTLTDFCSHGVNKMQVATTMVLNFGRGRVVRVYSMVGVIASIMGVWVVWNMIYYTSTDQRPRTGSRKMPHFSEQIRSDHIINENLEVQVKSLNPPPPVVFVPQERIEMKGVIHPPMRLYTEEPSTTVSKRGQILAPKFKKDSSTFEVTKNHINVKQVQVNKKQQTNNNKNNENKIKNNNKKVINKSKTQRNVNLKTKPKSKSDPKIKQSKKKNEFSNLKMQAIEEVMKNRRQRVKRVCGKYGYGPMANLKKNDEVKVKMPPTPHYSIFYIDRQDELAWCPIYKAASTSWLYNYSLLGGATDKVIRQSKDQMSVLTRRYWPELPYEDARLALSFCTKFMIVRHPFERLVSAYRDKLENLNIGREHGTLHFYEKYGKKIKEKYRNKGAKMHLYSQDMDNPNLPARKGVEPTFEEFVKYLIDIDLVYYSDDHWMPYYLHCTPCHVDYDVIAKFETLEEDQEYLIQKNKLQEKIQPSWKHLTKGKETSQMVQKYFSTISKDDLYKLYHKYRIDFELFDYNITDYLGYVRQNDDL